MNDSYIQEYPNPEEKKRILDLYYPSQKGLWESDAKFYLFETLINIKKLK